MNDIPLIVYPNNQQIIPSLNSLPPPHSILTIVSWKMHMGLVYDAGTAFLLSVSLPGYHSIQLNDSLSDISMSISAPCIPGTSRNSTNFGPCFLCSPNTKNHGNSGIECEQCVTNDSSVCLRGSLAEIDLINISDINQAVPYPDSPELVEFDDVLLHNLLSFMVHSPHCLLISPLFWISLAILFALIILLVICILNHFPQRKSQRTCLKKFFRHIDLITEGELWLGGLLTMAIIVLFIFTCKFSVSFTKLYPIASVPKPDDEMDSCSLVRPNVKFNSGLQLLSIPRHKEQEQIFKMLDKQNITLSVYFLSTGFICDDVMMQENTGRRQQIPLDGFNCAFYQETGILMVSTPLSQKMITLQLDLIGPHFVGGIRICLEGHGTVETNGKYTLKELQFCQLFFTENETVTTNPMIDMKMTKIINRTLGYSTSEYIAYSGLWAPTLATGTLSDQHLFHESGEHIRYLSDRMTLIITITESEFFVRNTEEPIARNSEIVLHTALLIGKEIGISLMIYFPLFILVAFMELFAFIFLLIKLITVPLIKCFRRHSSSNQNPFMENNQTDVQLVRFTRFSWDKISLESQLRTNHSENHQ